MHSYTSEKYGIEIGSLVESSFNDLLLKTYSKSRIVIIVDENTHDCCLEYLLTSFESLKESEVMLLPTGEENKVMEVCFQVWQALSEYKIGRSDLVINLGGGVVTDMGGFIASIYKRGVDFINIPTSLLGMVDASIGGKTGIDLDSFKNQLGVFSHPKKIFIDPGFLETLPTEELLNGLAEMFKHALINSREQWHQLKQLNAEELLNNPVLIAESVKVKFDIVEKDPVEKGIRKILNFGHTIGHGIEGYFLDKDPVSHGHAVAIGMVAESYIAMKYFELSKADYFDIEMSLMELYPIIYLSNESIAEIVELMRNDKKNSEDKILASLLTEIGSCEFDKEIDEDQITEALVYLNRFAVPMN